MLKLLALMAALLSGASGTLTSQSALANSVTVTITNYTFTPAKVVIHPGDSIIWRNQDSMPHTASAIDGASFDTGAIDPGTSSMAVVMKTTGLYNYHCAIHPDMRASVDVE